LRDWHRSVRSNSPARSQIATSILPPPRRKINQKSPSKNEGATPPPGRFSPNPVVLRLIVMFSAIVTGRILRFRPPGRKMKAIPQPPPSPNEYCRFFLLNAEPLCLPPSVRAHNPAHTDYCHVFEARDRAEQSNSSARWQFNDALNPPRRP
jgi:hypothetical protein